jgi:hypothetical protein
MREELDRAPWREIILTVTRALDVAIGSGLMARM